jgi:serine/threonine-protein kinase
VPDALSRLRAALAGRYQVERKLGEGGMATVYLAHDERHDRRVALKLLRPEISAAVGADRFLAEIRTTANLQHPNILPLFDSGTAAPEGDGVVGELLFYVMPYVEGESLRQRLDREGPLPVEEAVRIAAAVADALAYAHRTGVIHRDIKPENILLHEGRPLVADFGIALAAERVGAGRLTQTGSWVGTPLYSSPEQATGEGRVDHRTDVYSLGCVVYEMLVGEPPHTGPTARAIVGRALLKDPTPVRDRRPTVPAHVEAAVHTALQRLPADRFQSADQFGAALADRGYRKPGDAAAATARRRRWLWGAAWAASLLAAVWIAVLAQSRQSGAASDASTSRTGLPSISRFSHVLPEDQSFTGVMSHSLVAISPDGSAIVYVANDRLYRRALAELNAVPIRGTDGAPRSPFFSPDGQSVAYWDVAAGQLRKIAISGGTPVSLARATVLYGGSWGADDTILYGQADGVWSVPADGGAPELVVRIEPSELVYGPRMLPDGNTLLFTVVSRASMIGQSTAWDSARVVVEARESGARREILRGGDARYVPTGHLVFALDTVLYAVAFDLATQEVRGGPVPILESVQRTTRGSLGQAGGANFDFSRDGTLVYVPGGVLPGDLPRRLLAVDRQGNAERLIDEERDYWRPRISPDGTRVAVEVLHGGVAQVWIVDVDRRTSSPLTDAQSAYPLWTPDGRSVVFWSTRAGVRGIFRQPADGSGDAQLVLAGGRAEDASPNGVVAFNSDPATGLQSIRTLRLDDGSVSDFLVTPPRTYMSRFSPDGRWLAYTSNESGQDEVYVRPYPRTAGVGRLVSVGGGSGPVWSPNGSELYYRGSGGDLIAVPTTLSPTFTAGRPERLFRFEGRFRMSGTATAYDIHPDGDRFIMVSVPEVAPERARQVNVVQNWFAELRERMP